MNASRSPSRTPCSVLALVARPMILDLLVRVEHIAADLTPEARVLHLAAFARELSLAPLQLQLCDA